MNQSSPVQRLCARACDGLAGRLSWAYGNFARGRRAGPGLAAGQTAAGDANAESELTWDQRILATLPPGVDETQLREDLKLTPTQRLEKLQALLESVEALRGAR